jgi:Family of unknown function (DUF6188)
MAVKMESLNGLSLESVRFDNETGQWIFSFATSIVLQISCPWRVVAEGHVALGWRDDRQRFGLPAPVDARARLQGLVGACSVDTAKVLAHGDLVIRFASGAALEVFNDSCGYEGWQLHGPGHRYVVAQGGGNVVGSATDG